MRAGGSWCITFMPESDSNKGRKGSRKRKQGRKGLHGRAGLLTAIFAGTGFGALIGFLAGCLLSPRSRAASLREGRQALKAWQEMSRKLSEQLQIGGDR
jgi:hypothetical protein